MDEFVASRGWYAPESEKPQTAQNLAASISIEAAEILECVQWSERAKSDEIAGELADVVLYVAQLANVLAIDLGEAVTKKLELNHDRFAAVDAGQWVPRLVS